MSAIVIAFCVVAGVTLVVLLTCFLLGFRAGSRHYQSELQRTRFEAAHAERQLHNLTRQAFIAMSEHAYERQRGAT